MKAVLDPCRRALGRLSVGHFSDAPMKPPRRRLQVFLRHARGPRVGRRRHVRGSRGAKSFRSAVTYDALRAESVPFGSGWTSRRFEASSSAGGGGRWGAARRLARRGPRHPPVALGRGPPEILRLAKTPPPARAYHATAEEVPFHAIASAMLWVCRRSRVRASTSAGSPVSPKPTHRPRALVLENSQPGSP
jgi:hypothetical protein